MKEFISGKPCKYKSFKTKEEAIKWLEETKDTDKKNKLYLSTDGEFIYTMGNSYTDKELAYNKYEISTLSTNGKVFVYNNSKDYETAKYINEELSKMCRKPLKMIEVYLEIVFESKED